MGKLSTIMAEHPLRNGKWIVILNGTPLNFIGSKKDCEAVKARWDKKAEQYNKGIL